MNKQSIIGLVLIFAIFMGYMWWVAPSEEERAEMQRQHDSIVAAYADSVARAEALAGEMARLDSLAKAGDSNALKQLNIKQHSDMGAFNASTQGDSLNIHISNDVMALTLSNLGAQVEEVVLSNYTTFDSLPLQLITPAEDNMNLIFSCFVINYTFIIASKFTYHLRCIFISDSIYCSCSYYTIFWSNLFNYIHNVFSK